MTKFWIITILLIAVFAVLITKVSWNNYKKQNRKNTWKIWGLRMAYWEGIVWVSSGLIIVTLFLLKWTNLLTFKKR